MEKPPTDQLENHHLEIEQDIARMQLRPTQPLARSTESRLSSREEENQWFNPAASYAEIKPWETAGAFPQLCLLMPGTVLLYIGTVISTFFYPEIGLTLPMIFIIASGSFMVWAGSGSLSESKYLLVPTMVILFALVFSLIGFLFPARWQPQLFFYYSVYLLPVVMTSVYFLKRHLDLPDEGDISAAANG